MEKLQIKPVVQEDPMGCAVACVASVLSISYQEALRLFDVGIINKSQEITNDAAVRRGFYGIDIMQAFSKANKTYIYRYKYITTELLEKPGSLAFVNYSEKYPRGHWLARTENKLENRWMDPWLNFPQEPRIAGFRNKLPGKPIYVVYEIK